MPPDVSKLPLPEPGLPSWPRYMAWLELLPAHFLESEYVAGMRPTEREAWEFLTAFGVGGFPYWPDVVPYGSYKDRLSE